MGLWNKGTSARHTQTSTMGRESHTVKAVVYKEPCTVAYKHFDARDGDYTKVILKPELAGAAAR